MSWDQYSETPASNYITGYFLTGMAPSGVKVAGSDIMADLASRFAALHTTGGTANAQTLTQTRQLQALIAGLELIVIFGNTNTGAMTFAPDGLTAKNVNTNGAGILAGQAAQNAIGILKYDGTQWNLLNPSRVTGSFTGTPTGGTTAPTCTVTYRTTADFTNCTLIFGTGIAMASNATTFTITGMPASLTPAQTQAYYTTLEDNTAATVGSIIFTAASAVITLAKNAAIGTGASNFTASGTKAFANGATTGTNIAVTFVIN